MFICWKSERGRRSNIPTLVAHKAVSKIRPNHFAVEAGREEIVKLRYLPQDELNASAITDWIDSSICSHIDIQCHFR